MKSYIPPKPINAGHFLYVVISVGIIATALLPKFTRQIGFNQSRLAQSDIVTFSNIFGEYYIDNGNYPTTTQSLKALLVKPTSPPIPNNWKGPYVKKYPPDPWGHEYKYKCPGIHNPNNYDIWSVRKDGLDGTKDDITNWDNKTTSTSANP